MLETPFTRPDAATPETRYELLQHKEKARRGFDFKGDTDYK